MTITIDTTTDTTTADTGATTTEPALRDALTACLLSVAGKVDNFPLLRAVLFEKRGDELKVRSTDRYRLTIVTLKLEPGSGQDFTVLVGADDVKRIIGGLAKRAAGPRSWSPALPVVLRRAGDALTVTTFNGEQRASEVDGEFPKTDRLVPDAADEVPTGTIGFNPSFLADLCKMPGRDRCEPVKLRFYGATKPATSTWGDDTVSYFHMLMPVRSAA